MMKYLLLKCLFILLLAGAINPSFGPNPSSQETWFLTSLRDKAGNLWFGTGGQGVYRFDAGTGEFRHFTEAEGLCGNGISYFYEDRAGRLWVATNKGVCRYDGSSFTAVSIQEGQGQKMVTCITEDRQGRFWFGTMGYGITRYDPATGAKQQYTKAQGLWGNSIQCITEDRAGTLWIGERDGGASRYDPSTNRIVKVNGKGCLSSQIMDIVEDRAGQLWFANLYEALCRMDPATGDITKVSEKEGLCGDVITCLYEDAKGNLWASSGTNTPGILRSTPTGLCRIDGSTFTLFAEKEGLRDLDVWTIVEDRNRALWVGTKGGLFRYHAPSGKFVEMTHKLKQ